ncbi:MAG: hypothetical protein ABI954_07845 [Pyrinomonadaceae bacterium]
MKIKKEIVIEIEHVRVICQRTKRSLTWCRECDAESDFVTTNEAAALIDQTLDQIADLVSTGVIHVGITPARNFLVCLNSLLSIGVNSTDVSPFPQIKN